MIEVREFFRHCPGCGRRFHIKLEEKKLVGTDRESTPRMRQMTTEGAADWERIPILVHDERPVMIDIEEFQYAYKCKHCGHEWREKHLVEHRER